ncbi:gamma-glutamyl hydrolase A-like isoform X2 [Eupeodes corollae]|uniref:gamma-glutamyl hydrolase A-like isoform X2 n=1 Tax=Eupeodes corollae TaxID=290404 RepID=UPI002490795A|nr:gamma-glutamyl hydrolase A-like isoform X2 [Eupeodes corollae]
MLQSRVAFLISMSAAVFLCCAPIVVNSYIVFTSEPEENATPIVGVLTQEVSFKTQIKYPCRNLTSYIAASYVKFVEGAGARAVPIWIGQSPEYYKDIVTKVNGILFPGGATSLNKSNGYAEAGFHLFQAAKELNEQGIYFPIWATCLGFELLTYIEANKKEHRSSCSSQKQPLPLEFKEGYNKSRLFGNAPDDVISILKKHNVTANFHQYCITEKTFEEYGFDKDWDILSVNHDWNNFKFISTIEHKRYPFYGVQYHPEKNLYEFIENRGIPHSAQSIRAAQYFADFFINETRQNMNKFSDSKEEENSLIYNYTPEFTGRAGSSFVQQYLFTGNKTANTSSEPTRTLAGWLWCRI